MEKIYAIGLWGSQPLRNKLSYILSIEQKDKNNIKYLMNVEN